MSSNPSNPQIVTKENDIGTIDEAVRHNSQTVAESSRVEAAKAEEASRLSNQEDKAHGQASTAIIEETVGTTAIKVASAVAQTVMDSDPASSGASKSQTTMEQMIKGEGGKAEVQAAYTEAPAAATITPSPSIWSDPFFCISEKANVGGDSLSDKISGAQADEQEVAALTQQCVQVQSAVMLSAQHLGNAHRAKAEHVAAPNAPTPGGMGSNAPTLRADARMAKGPAFIDDKQAAKIQEQIDAGKATDWG